MRPARSRGGPPAARLGVPVDTQPAWHDKDADALSDERLASFIGLETWRRAGVTVAINADHMFGLDPNDAMNPFDPFLTMYSGTTRRTESGRVIGEAEAVSRPDALRMMTSAAARFQLRRGESRVDRDRQARRLHRAGR